MDEIQEKLVKQGKRNVISRHFNAKYDKERIAAWRLDFIRILNVFNVCSVVPARLSLTACFQTELAINTHTAVSDTHDMVSGIYRTVVKSQGGDDGQNLSVGDTGTVSALITCSLQPRLKPGQHPRLSVEPTPYFCI